MLKPVATSAMRSWAAVCQYLMVAAIATMAAAPAWSQTTYKCGSSYSQNPCEGGVAVDTDDKRTADQKKHALDATQKQKQFGDKLEQTRLAEEKRMAADLKKADAAKKKVSAHQGKTTLRPIKNKKIKPDADAPAEKTVKNNQGKKSKTVAGDKQS